MHNLTYEGSSLLLYPFSKGWLGIGEDKPYKVKVMALWSKVKDALSCHVSQPFVVASYVHFQTEYIHFPPLRF